MNRQLVYAENKTLFLDTSMNAAAFTKARMAERLSENGWLAEKSDGIWKFSPWYFTATRQQKCYDESLSMAARLARQTILLEGEAFSGKTLKALFDLNFSKELGETEISFVTYAAAKTCAVLEEAARQNIDLYNIGAGGIFISADYQKIIFLPKSLFENSIQCAGTQAAAEYNGYFVNPVLKDRAAINFTQSVIAYRMLTGSYPFEENNPTNRNWDILDNNYIPLRNKVWALDDKLSFFVDNALQRKGKIVGHGKKKGEKKRSISEKISSVVTNDNEKEVVREKQIVYLSFPLENLYKETGLTANGEIPAGGHVSAVIRKSTVSPDQFEKKAAAQNRVIKSRVERIRWFRRNKVALIIAACIFVVGIGVALTCVSTYMRRPTSKSLTSFETVAMFYSGLNQLDVTAVQACSTKNGGNNFISLINDTYISTKTQSNYNTREICVSPAEWFCYNYDGNYNIFGVSQLRIDGVNASTFFKGPAKKKKPQPLTKEYGSSVANGATKNYIAKYYLVTYENKESITVFEQADEVHLLFYNDRWIINSVIPHEISRKDLNRESFVNDFKIAWEKSSCDPKKTAELLRNDYNWLPTDIEIDGGQIATDISRNPFAIEE